MLSSGSVSYTHLDVYKRQVIDYTYLNYNLAEVEADYERVSDELSDAQLALDAVNSSETFEFDF